MLLLKTLYCNMMKNVDSVESMIRVNHAGEYGAKRIYAGQQFVLGYDEAIQHMAEQEQEHLDAFTHMVVEHQVRPSVLQPLWHVGGFALGAVTAAMGVRVAHACTAAVETVIDGHYQEQLQSLNARGVDIQNDKLAQLIEKCREDEVAHKDMAEYMAGGDLDAMYPVTSKCIRAITKLAIGAAKRI